MALIQPTTDRDRRGGPRVVFCDPIEVLREGGRVHMRGRDLSSEGLSVEAGQLEPGARVRVRFSLGAGVGDVDAMARVVRADGETAGLRFEQLAWLGRADLERYVTSVRRGTRPSSSPWDDGSGPLVH